MKNVLSATFIATLLAAPLTAKAQVIQIDGSSTVFPVTEAVAEEFQKQNPALLFPFSQTQARASSTSSLAVLDHLL